MPKKDTLDYLLPLEPEGWATLLLQCKGCHMVTLSQVPYRPDEIGPDIAPVGPTCMLGELDPEVERIHSLDPEYPVHVWRYVGVINKPPYPVSE